MSSKKTIAPRRAYGPTIEWAKGTWVVACLLWIGSSVEAQFINDSTQTTAPTNGDAMRDDAKLWNLELPTLGGKQFWTDHRWWYGWRVQYNSTLDHWRLLDPKDVRRAWGGRQAMLDELEIVKTQFRPEKELTEVVLLMHGLMRSSKSMQPIEAELDRVDQQNQLLHPETSQSRTAVYFTYASTRSSIASHAEALRELVENLPGHPKISAVGHSLGNIVLRHAIGDWERDGDPTDALGRLNRIVMLGPPNHGSAFAKRISKLGLFETITGTSGMQLGPAWDHMGTSLGTPPCPFAIIAGDISKSPIQNPFLDGTSDGVVTIEEASLDGMAEIASVPVLHSFLMSEQNAVRATVSFLSGTGLKNALETN